MLVNWQAGAGADWAFACDFKGGDLTNAKVRGQDCGGRCAATSGCTHFTWTTYNGGTCWMKSGSISKSDALYTGDDSMVCGIISSGPGPNPNPNPGILFNNNFNYWDIFDGYI